MEEGILQHARNALITEQVFGPGQPGEKSDLGMSLTENTPDIVHQLGFAEPSDVTLMLDYFDVVPGIADEETTSLMKDIYDIAKRSGNELLDFLTEAGLRVGGRFSPGFMGKVAVYLKSLQNEVNLQRRLDLVRRERMMYESTPSSDL